MPSRRSSGLLLHPTSLPGPYGIGDLGTCAFEFIDLLAATGQRVWQILPLGPTGYGDSPYQCFSAFAGNPLLISLDRLVEVGLLRPSECGHPQSFPIGPVDYGAVIAHRRGLWPKVLERFDAAADPSLRDGFTRFCDDHAGWLGDFALFMAIKDACHGRPWTEWDGDLARRDPAALERWSARCRREIRLHALNQFLFFEQWHDVRRACHARRIQLLGDLPIFVAHDSADVWAHQELFRLDSNGQPTVLTGVPPDYFSASGQLWGNPHYRWDALARSGYAWWVDRVRATLRLVDRVRIDHFRGFEASWEVPGRSSSAVHGEWAKGPGIVLFNAMRAALELDHLPLVAENLGIITPEVEALRAELGLPGMAILQFAFGTDPQASSFRPHNYQRDLVAYTGTHDNDTTVGWWTGEIGHSTRSSNDLLLERERARTYLDLNGREVHWEFIRAVLASVADTTVIPVQDVLGLGSDARMNIPGKASGNWRWRLQPGRFLPVTRARLAAMTEAYERA